MCGGAPKPAPPRNDPPPPEAPAELILSDKKAAAKGAKLGRKKLQKGRSALVTPGLTVAGGTPTGTGLGTTKATV
jgi:hypothetical protein